MTTETKQPKKQYHEFVDAKYPHAITSAHLIDVYGEKLEPDEVYFDPKMTIRDFYVRLQRLLLDEKPPRRLESLLNVIHPWMPRFMSPNNFDGSEESTMRGSNQLGHNPTKFGDMNILHLYQQYSNRDRYIEFVADTDPINKTKMSNAKSLKFAEFFDSAAWGVTL